MNALAIVLAIVALCSAAANAASSGKLRSYAFPSDFDKLNPRNPNAEWRWGRTGNDDYTAPSVMVVRTGNGVDFSSDPFQAYKPQDGTKLPPLWIQYESIIFTKKEYQVQPGQKLTLNAKFTCKTNKEGASEYDQTATSNASDDPSAVTCGVGLASKDESALVFSIVGTNKGVWAMYERNRFSLFEHPELKQKEFTVFHRLGDRQSASEVIDASIEYDRSAGKVNYMLNGNVVYTISELGTINEAVQENPQYAEAYTVDRSDFVKVEPKVLQAVIFLAELPDTVDPSYTGSSPLRGTRLSSNADYYDPKAKFFDEKGVKKYTIWGQGAHMGIKSVEIKQ